MEKGPKPPPSSSLAPRRRSKHGPPTSNHNSSADKNKPRRPLSAYNIFFREQREQILRERRSNSAAGNCRADDTIHTTTTTKGKEFFASMGKEVAKRWYEIANTSQVQHYKDLAALDMERYRKEKLLCGDEGKPPSPRNAKGNKKKRKKPQPPTGHNDDNCCSTATETNTSYYTSTSSNDNASMMSNGGEQRLHLGAAVELSDKGSTTTHQVISYKSRGLLAAQEGQEQDPNCYYYRGPDDPSFTCTKSSNSVSESERTIHSFGGNQQGKESILAYFGAASSALHHNTQHAVAAHGSGVGLRHDYHQNDNIKGTATATLTTPLNEASASLAVFLPNISAGGWRTEYTASDRSFLPLVSNHHGSTTSSDDAYTNHPRMEDPVSSLAAAMFPSTTSNLSSLLPHHSAPTTSTIASSGITTLQDIQRRIAARNFDSILFAPGVKNCDKDEEEDKASCLLLQSQPGTSQTMFGTSDKNDATAAAALIELVQANLLREKDKSERATQQYSSHDFGNSFDQQNLSLLAMALKQHPSNLLAVGNYPTSIVGNIATAPQSMLINPATAPTLATATRSQDTWLLQEYYRARSEVLHRLARLRQQRNTQTHFLGGAYRTLFCDLEASSSTNDLHLNYQLEQLLGDVHREESKKDSSSLLNTIPQINDQAFSVERSLPFFHEPDDLR